MTKKEVATAERMLRNYTSTIERSVSDRGQVLSVQFAGDGSQRVFWTLDEVREWHAGAEAMAGIAAIRKDKIVGSGTCSVIDEAFTDDELREGMAEDGVVTAKQALAWARRIHRCWAAREREVRSEIF